MGQMGSGTWSNIILNSTLQCRSESRNRLEEYFLRGAESGTKEFIGFYKAATGINIGYRERPNKFYIAALSHLRTPVLEYFCFFLYADSVQRF